MPRPHDQTDEAIRKDIARIDLVLGRARRNKQRSDELNREIIAKLSWVKLKLTEEAVAVVKAPRRRSPPAA